jgi:hypothetical protein
MTRGGLRAAPLFIKGEKKGFNTECAEMGGEEGTEKRGSSQWVEGRKSKKAA